MVKKESKQKNMASRPLVPTGVALALPSATKMEASTTAYFACFRHVERGKKMAIPKL
jgi:hypothetical protein